MGMRWIGPVLFAALAALPGPALARQGWNCTFEGTGSNPAHFVTRLERRGDFLLERHWPAATAYRILIDSRDMLIAARATATRPSFRRDARGEATVLFIDKLNGRMRRTVSATGELGDQALIGICERW